MPLPALRRWPSEAALTGGNPDPAEWCYQDSMKSALALCLMLAGAVTVGAAGLHAAEKQDGMADLQQSIRRSTSALQGQAAQIQAAQAQQRAEGAGMGGIGVQVVNPGLPPPVAPTTPSHCVTRYTGATVFTDCR